MTLSLQVKIEACQQGLSLKDSLAAVCNATQAAARIHQFFRVQSFQKKQLKEYGDGEYGMSDERALSLLAVKTNIAGYQDEPVHAAATRIQNESRSYKGRKEFLILRQRVVKIQSDAVDPKSRHKGKLNTESLLQSRDVNWSSLRPVYIYGPLNYNLIEEWFFHRLSAGCPIPIPGSGLQVTQLGHVQEDCFYDLPYRRQGTEL